MARANDVSAGPDLAQVRTILEVSLTKLMDAQDYLAGQIAVLDGIERQVRILALRETTRALGANADADALRDLGELQAETNANFRQMRETYARLSAQIALLKAQQQTLYAATGTRAAGGTA